MNFSIVILTATILALSTIAFAEEMNLDTAKEIIKNTTLEYLNCEDDHDCLVVTGRCNRPVSINITKATIYNEASKLLSTSDSCEQKKEDLPPLRALCNEMRIHCNAGVDKKGPLCAKKICQLWAPYTE